MPRLLVPIIVIALYGAASLSPVLAAQRVALIVGNADYQQATPLNNTRRDAEAIAETFGRLGFEVILELDASQSATLDALDRFATALRGAEAAVFYYSGHGIQASGENYVLPVDIDITSERSLRYGAINIADVVHDMERESAVSLVILDACRDNPFIEELQRSLPATRSAAVTRGLALMRPQSSGTIIAYAAAAGATASDGSEAHSPYTQALLNELETPDVEVGLLFRRVAGRVVEATNGDQRPELLVRLTHEFYLNRTAIAAADTVGPAVEETQTATPAATDSSDDTPLDVADETDEASRGWDSAGLLPTIEPAFAAPPSWVPAATASHSEREDNNSFGTAQAIGVNDRVTMQIFPRRDVDWYRFSIAQAGELSVSAGNVPATLDVNARLHNSDTTAIGSWVAAPRNGGDLEAVFDVPAPGEYWLEVADGRSDAEAEDTFELVFAYRVQADLFEPNNSFGMARVMPLNGTFAANILPRKDADWFRVQSVTPGEFAVTATNVPENIEVTVRLHDANGGVVGNWTGPTRPGGDTYAVFDLPAPGDYRLEVVDSRNDQRSIEPFNLTTAFTPSNDRFEPNDSFGAAATIAPNGHHRFTVFPRRDVDWLRIEVDHPGELQFIVTQVPPDLDVNIRVHNQDKQVLQNWVAPARMGADTIGFADLPAAGAYYLEIADGRNDGRAITTMRIETRFIPTADQYEPNDSYGLATPISPGGEIAFNILPLRDTDWFQIRVDQPGELWIEIDEGPEDLDLRYRVWNADKKAITGWAEPYSMGGLTQGFADLVTAGVYYLEVADGRNDGRSAQHATLKTRFTPTHASLEPNDTFGAAHEVPLQGETQVHILPLRDVDWHRFEVPGPGQLNIYVDQVPDALDINVRLHSAERRAMGGWIGPNAPGGDTDAAFTIETAGWYWLEISDGRSDARSAAPFRVQRSFIPAAQ
jgi:uncharacterized caspase-like protein